MARTDIHRPSEIRPEDYEFVTCFGLSTTDGGFRIPSYGIDYTIVLRKKAKADGVEFSPIHDALNTCDVCGAWFKEGAVWRHVPTGDYLTLGHTCTAKYEIGSAIYDAARRAAGNAKKVSFEKARRRGWFLANIAKAREFLKTEPELKAALRENRGHKILKDMTEKVLKWGELSDRQIEFAMKLAHEVRNPPPPDPEAIPVPVTDARTKFEGVVVATKWKPGYGYNAPDVLKMIVRVAGEGGAFKIWGSVPSSILADIERGDTVEFYAKVEPSKDDPAFGFFSRPTKAKITKEAAA